MPTRIPRTIRRALAEYFGVQVTSVINASVGATPLRPGTGSMTSTALGATTSLPRTR